MITHTHTHTHTHQLEYNNIDILSHRRDRTLSRFCATLWHYITSWRLPDPLPTKCVSAVVSPNRVSSGTCMWIFDLVASATTTHWGQCLRNRVIITHICFCNVIQSMWCIVIIFGRYFVFWAVPVPTSLQWCLCAYELQVSIHNAKSLTFGGDPNNELGDRPQLLIDYLGSGCGAIVISNSTDVRIWTSLYSPTHPLTRSRTHTRTHARTHARTRTHTQTHTHTHTHTWEK